MRLKAIIIAIGILIMIALGAFVFRGKGSQDQIQYTYQAVTRGDVTQSVEETGIVTPLTQVDVKSKAGGIVEKLYVHVGSIVKKGQLIALIDPRDTLAAYQQAQADMSSAQAQEEQANVTFDLQKQQSQMGIQTAEEALKTAEIQKARAKVQYIEQPAISEGNYKVAVANYQAAVDDYNKLVVVTIPQTKRDESGSVYQTKAQRDSDLAQLNRDKDLVKKGFISQSQLEKDQAIEAGSEQAYELAKQRFSTLGKEVSTTIKSQAATVARLKAAVNQAKASLQDTQVAKTNYQQASEAVLSAQTALNIAISNQANNQIKKDSVLTAQSNIVRTKVAEQNAQVQLESTKVVAPRDGVITLRYLTEGTIIPPGTSVYSQGTSLVQISDISKLYVDCTVDEADISTIKVGQRVQITAEAYKDQPVMGVVIRVDPAAVTANNVTTVLAKVLVLPHPKQPIELLPGMNCSCQFIIMDRPNVIQVPSQAVQTDSKGTFVLVKGTQPDKPVTRYVEIGAQGDDSVEITHGLKVGDQVVIATINVTLDKEIQKQMEEGNSGGLAGGGGPKRKSYATKTKAKPKLILPPAKSK